MEVRKRIEWIDYAKVIGIWLVILGHILNAGRPVENELHTLIYSFHMPFFFFVSGLLFSTKEMNFVPFVITKIKSLIVPYILLNILCVVLSAPLYIFPDVFPTTNLQTLSQDLLTLVDGEFGSVYAPPSWFLITLFVVMIISFFVSRLHLVWQLFVLVIAIAMTYVVMIWQVPLNIDTIPGAFVFFLLGYILKGHLKDLSIKVWYLLLLFLMIMMGYSVLALFNGPVQINHIIGRTCWLYWLIACLGISMLYLFSNFLVLLTHTSILLQLLSSGMIFIVCVHETCIAYTIDFFLVNHSFHIPLVLREMILSIAILIICVPFIALVRKYMPILIGNRQ